MYFIVIIIAKFFDPLAFFLAGVILIFTNSKWGILISGVVTTFLSLIVMTAVGSGVMRSSLIFEVVVAGVISHSAHAAIFYYIRSFFRYRKIKKRLNAN